MYLSLQVRKANMCALTEGDKTRAGDFRLIFGVLLKPVKIK
jgi:hypothetical protein